MDDVVVPPYRVARLDPWDGDESLRSGAVPARIEGQGVAGRGAAEVVAGDVGLQGSKDDPSHQIGDGDELQRPVPGPLLRECRPALEGAKHAAYCRRRDLVDGHPVRRVEGVVACGVTEEHLAVDALVARIAPALDRPAVRVRRQAQRPVAGLAPAQTIGVRALSRRVEGGRFGRGLAPYAVQSRSNPRQLIALPRAHLRLRPVEAVDLRRRGGQRGEIAVQTDPALLLFGVAVPLHVLADLVVPGGDAGGREHAPDHHAAAAPDPLGDGSRNMAGGEVAIVELGDRSSVPTFLQYGSD